VLVTGVPDLPVKAERVSCSCHTSSSRKETASAGSARLPATATAIFARLRKFNLVRKFAMNSLQNQDTCVAQAVILRLRGSHHDGLTMDLMGQRRTQCCGQCCLATTVVKLGVGISLTHRVPATSMNAAARRIAGDGGP
jgi:hypothetical protein